VKHEIIIDATISEPASIKDDEDTVIFIINFYSEREGDTVGKIQTTHIGDLFSLADKINALHPVQK